MTCYNMARSKHNLRDSATMRSHRLKSEPLLQSFNDVSRPTQGTCLISGDTIVDEECSTSIPSSGKIDSPLNLVIKETLDFDLISIVKEDLKLSIHRKRQEKGLGDIDIEDDEGPRTYQVRMHGYSQVEFSIVVIVAGCHRDRSFRLISYCCSCHSGRQWSNMEASASHCGSSVAYMIANRAARLRKEPIVSVAGTITYRIKRIFHDCDCHTVM